MLAGGLGRRLGGGDKALRRLAGRPLLAHVIDRIRPQVEILALNANGDLSRFAAWNLPVIADTIGDNPGPLAGILAGMEWVQQTFPETTDIVSVPTDTPFLPQDLVDRLQDARDGFGAEIALAASQDRTHPVIGLWPIRFAPDLRYALARGGLRKVEDFAARYRVTLSVFANQPVDPFYNVNCPEDFTSAESLARLLSN